LLNLKTNADRLVTDNASTSASMSDDGRRVVYLQGGNAWQFDVNSPAPRALTTADEVALSGNGRVAFVATGGRLLKIDTESGVETEIIRRTPFILGPTGGEAGRAITTTARGLISEPLRSGSPLETRLGGVSLLADARPLPLIEVTPSSIRYLIPWD